MAKDPGAVVAEATLSLVPVLGGPGAVLLNAVTEWYREFVDGWVAGILDDGDVALIGQKLTADPVFYGTFVQAATAATRTGLAAKRRVLVRAVKAAAMDDAKHDDTQLIVGALADLEAVHVHALVRLRALVDDPEPADREERVAHLSGAWHALPAPVRAALTRTGCTDIPTGAFGGPGLNGYQDVLVAEFGRRLLTSLERQDREGDLG